MSRRTSSASPAIHDLTPSTTNLHGLEGQILVKEDIARIVKRGVSTILREIRAGTFKPAPFRAHPYQWYRADVEEHFAKRPRFLRRKPS